MKLFAFVFLIAVQSLASIEVAFVSIRTPEGRQVQFESKGSFVHVAISYQGGWLHSHPYRGVEWITTEALEKTGQLEKIITVSETESLAKAEVRKYLGKPYDADFTWNDDKIYCSELVAKLLHIAPKPMSFDTKIWPKHLQDRKGELGISPDDIFKFLKKQGYQARSYKPTCARLF